MNIFPRRRSIVIFALIQSVGFVSEVGWQLLKQDSISIFLWYIAAIAFLPGNIVSNVIIEKFLWMKGFSLNTLVWSTVPLQIVINVVFWFGICGPIKQVFSRVIFRRRT